MMFQSRSENIPKDGLSGLKAHWKDDFRTSISVALLALPLSMAIAIASGVQPLAGLLSCVIDGGMGITQKEVIVPRIKSLEKLIKLIQ